MIVSENISAGKFDFEQDSSATWWTLFYNTNKTKQKKKKKEKKRHIYLTLKENANDFNYSIKTTYLIGISIINSIWKFWI